jgi:hypothetical protein
MRLPYRYKYNANGIVDGADLLLQAAVWYAEKNTDCIDACTPHPRRDRRNEVGSF